MRNVLLLCLLPLLMAHVPAASAGRLADFQVINARTGEELALWRHAGRLYVEGTPGERYAVRLANRSQQRLLMVLSVDGVNALTGETAAAQQAGYVLDYYGSSAQIRGWRKRLDEVAAFYFTALPDSYAARTERPDNVGVIGVAVFRERRVRPAPPIVLEGEPSGISRRSKAAEPAAPAAASGVLADKADKADSARETQRLGTGHGERLDDQVTMTTFERAGRTPDEILTIYYDSRANLLARGIIPSVRRPMPPQAFPGGFVADPLN